ncbi:peptidoglycan DD-metalloendopeptidase family protein [bacterium]|nr:peptidoglycan DD-metalloendopeptidase family protein [bacterium]
MSIPAAVMNLSKVHKNSSASHKRMRGVTLLGLWACCLICLLFLSGQPVIAQSAPTYTVQTGDTLGQIATRFGISVEALAAANAIDDINRISVGQVLLIPGADQTLPTIISRPGETLFDLADRTGITTDQLAVLNGLDTSTRLFPGQPIAVPANRPNPAFRFGALTGMGYPAQIVQGKTGRLQITSSRPVSLNVTWNGLPLALSVAPTNDESSRYTAHIPVPALLGPGPFPLDVAYTARNGVTVRRMFPINVVNGGYLSQEINLPPDRGALLAPEITSVELITVTQAWSATDTPAQWFAPFLRPVSAEYPTTSPYGIRRSYNGGPYDNYHAGQDFGAPVGVTVTVPADGIVSWAGPLVVRGNAVIIDHGKGTFTGYWHLSDMFVEEGQRVAAGDLLGLVGNTGLSTGAHLHWELRIYGIAVDPMQFLEEPLFQPDETLSDG